jgi:hypothetical protein
VHTYGHALVHDTLVSGWMYCSSLASVIYYVLLQVPAHAMKPCSVAACYLCM